MRFLLLCYFGEKAWEALPDLQRDPIMREYGGLLQSLHTSGRHLASAQLKAASTAATVRSKGGKATITDGPFAETKEQLGGYHLIECEGLNEAISIAKRIPTIPFGGVVEVRAVEP